MACCTERKTNLCLLLFFVATVSRCYAGMITENIHPDVAFNFIPEVSRLKLAGESWPSVDGDYLSVFKYKDNDACPKSMQITGTEYVLADQTDLSSTQLAKIKENGGECTGGTLFTASLTFLNSPQGQSYAQISHGNLSRRLEVNKVAFSNMQSAKLQGARLGYDDYSGTERKRICGGSNSGDEYTFWLHIDGNNVRNMTFTSTNSTGGTKTDLVEFPLSTKGIFLMDYFNGRYCILRTNADASPLSPVPTTEAPQTVATTTVITTAMTTDQIDPTTLTTSPVGTGADGDRANSGATCFPGESYLELQNGNMIPMSQLKLGDVVKTGHGTYSPVFAFTHKIVGGSRQFIRIWTTSGHSISATSGHFIYASGALKAAGAVRQGDVLTLGNGKYSTVTAVEVVSLGGLYNPQTLHGDIVVDGVLSSTYTMSVEPTLAHLALAPLRALYQTSGVSTRMFETGFDVLRQALPKSVEVFR